MQDKVKVSVHERFTVLQRDTAAGQQHRRLASHFMLLVVALVGPILLFSLP